MAIGLRTHGGTLNRSWDFLGGDKGWSHESLKVERNSEGLTERGRSGALKETSKGQTQGRCLSTRDPRHTLHEDLCAHTQVILHVGICVKGRSQPWALSAPQDTFHMFF